MHTDSGRERGSQRWFWKEMAPDALGRAKMSPYKALRQGRWWVRRLGKVSVLDSHE